MRDVLFVKDGWEYFLNEDGKLVSSTVDAYKDYRRNELPESVNMLLDRARDKDRYPKKALIDNLVSMCDYSITKAENYVKYKLLGEASYLDVFGQAAEDRYSAERHYKKTEDIEMVITAMAAQIEEMQRLMFNLAKQANKEYREELRYNYKKAL